MWRTAAVIGGGQSYTLPSAAGNGKPAPRGRCPGARRWRRPAGLQADDDSSYIAYLARRMACDNGMRPRSRRARQEDPMLRSSLLLLVFAFLVGVSGADAQTKKAASPARTPTAKDNSISVTVYLRDANKNELLLGTRIWPGYPDYNTIALQRYFAVMKALEPAYQQDDEVAYTWAAKGKVTKCSIYLEAAEAGVKNGTGAIVGCEANGVSTIAVASAADPKRGPSPSGDPKHVSDVLEAFKKQSERARNSLPK
jgi:hypothetical protein